MQKNIRERIAIISFLSLSFCFLFIFFSQINPIVVFDNDDWAYICYSRPAVPIWNAWNPSRILPETLMRVCADFGAFILNPFLHDYVFSLTVVFAITVSLFICVYLYRFIKLIKARFGYSIIIVIDLSTIFLLFHFLVFRKNEINNEYLFRAIDATCYFFYIIPALLNASIVLFLLEKRK